MNRKARKEARKIIIKKSVSATNRLANTGQKTFTKALKNTKKAYSYSGKTSNYFLNFGNQRGPQVQRSVGRPKGEFKHVDPFTKKAIPATIYYQRKKLFDRIAQQRANLEDQKKIQQLAKRGIPPEQAKIIVDNAQIRSVIPMRQEVAETRNVDVPEEYRNVPLQRGQVIDRSTRVWKYRRGELDRDWTAFGSKVVERGSPKAMWN